MIANRALQVLSSSALLLAVAVGCCRMCMRLRRRQSARAREHAFSAQVAHELRGPLTNLILNAEITLVRPRTASELQAALQASLKELQVLRAIVDDMLFLARAEQGAGRSLVESGVAQEVQASLAAFDAALRAKGLVTRVQGELQARALLDGALFRRAMANLLQNAIAHSRAQACLTVEVARQGASVWIRVINAGDTIPRDHLSRLFDPFYRVEPAHACGEVPGHGLGLSIVKAIATLHGGSVAAASRAGITEIGFSVPALSHGRIAKP